MKCTNCGTEIADKAIVCFRCGTPTAIPADLRPAAPPAPPRRSVVIPLIIVVLAVVLAVLAPPGSTMRKVAAAVAGIELVVGVIWPLVRRRR
jgi:zinc-ribbon domain